MPRSKDKLNAVAAALTALMEQQNQEDGESATAASTFASRAWFIALCVLLALVLVWAPAAPFLKILIQHSTASDVRALLIKARRAACLPTTRST